EAGAAYRRARELSIGKGGRTAAVRELVFFVAVLIDEGKLQEARALVEGLTPEERAAVGADRATDLVFSAVAARLQPPPLAEKQLADLAARARSAGFVQRELGIELALGKLQLKA